MAGRALVVLIALAALTPLLSVDRAAAETHGVACIHGQWVHTVDGRFSGYPGARSGIPCDEPKPGWVFDLDGTGRIVWVYDGDRVPTPYTNPGSNVVHVAIREVQAQGNIRPRVNQPVATPQQSFLYLADADNRAVRGDDGNCYREWRVNGRWLRSNPYHPLSCRKASWNAYLHSQGRSLIEPSQPPSAFPAGVPGVLVSNMSHPSHTSQYGATGADHAQAFTTGDNDNGYVFSKVEVFFEITTPGGRDPSTTLEIWSSQDGRPLNKLATLPTPSPLIHGVNAFNAPVSGIRLKSGTTYVVVLDWTADGNTGPRLITTTSNGEVGASGWSVSNMGLTKDHAGTTWDDVDFPRKISIHGYAVR